MRLHDIAVNAQEAERLRCLIAADVGEDNNPYASPPILAPQLLEHLVAVHFRHEQVEQYKVGPESLGQRQAFDAVRGALRTKPTQAQLDQVHVADRQVVLDNRYFRFVSHRIKGEQTTLYN